MTLEFTCRLVDTVFPDANLYIGWHWDPAALARWTSMMPLVSFYFRTGSAAQDNLAGGRWELGEARSRLVKEMLKKDYLHWLGDAGNSGKVLDRRIR